MLMTFRTTVAAIVVAAATIPVVALAWPAIHRITDGIRANAERELALEASAAADKITSDLTRLGDHTRAVIVDSDVRRAVKSVLFLERADRRLTVFLEENPLVAAAYLIGQDGAVVTAMPERALAASVPKAALERAAKLAGASGSGDRRAVGVVELSGGAGFQDGEVSELAFVAPVEGLMDRNGGALLALVPVESLKTALGKLLPATEGRTAELLGKAAAAARRGTAAAAESSLISARAPVSVLASGQASAAPSFDVVLAEPAARRLADVRVTIERLSALVAGVVACLGIAGFFVARLLLKPIDALRGQAAALAGGRYGAEPPAVAFTEFQEVAKTLAVMGRHVERHLAGERARMEAELNALRSQMSPHFLFNTLNAIATTIGLDPGLAAAMLEKLASLYRLILASTKTVTAPLATELEIVRLYLDLEVLRFGKRLTYEVEAPAEAASVQVPGLVLQTLVENAVKHGIARARQGGSVTVSVTRAPEAADAKARWRVVVRNTGAPLESKSPGAAASPSEGGGVGGVGLANTAKRLELLYGEAAALRLATAADGATEASFVITAADPRGGLPS
jgi:HAMP domain-containing protein